MTSLAVKPTVYITGRTCTVPEIQRPPYTGSTTDSDGASTPTAPSDISEGDRELPKYSSLKIIHGRPSIRRILQDGIDNSTGSVSVDGQCCSSSYSFWLVMTFIGL